MAGPTQPLRQQTHPPACLDGGREAPDAALLGQVGVSPCTEARILPGVLPAPPALGRPGGECDVLWAGPILCHILNRIGSLAKASRNNPKCLQLSLKAS